MILPPRGGHRVGKGPFYFSGKSRMAPFPHGVAWDAWLNYFCKPLKNLHKGILSYP